MMTKIHYLLSFIFLACVLSAPAQEPVAYTQDSNIPAEYDGTPGKPIRKDSANGEKIIPRGIKVWTVDERFGDRKNAEIDTASYMYMKTMFTTGLRGEYNTTGNMGAPRIARIYIDRLPTPDFLFIQPYDYFVRPVNTFHFTNTYSPITNVTLNECGNRTNGEDDFKALFAVNAGKRIGVGFRFDYKYARGYYDSQSTSHFGYTMWGSYLGERYQAHLLMSTNHQKVTENGGITNDRYVTHPETFDESYSTDEIPHNLAQNWNRNDNQHIFFTQRYNVGFNRKVRMTDEEIKARKFAIESRKEQERREARQKAYREAQKKGDDFDEKDIDKYASAGRPDNAKIAGEEPADTTSRKNNRVRITEGQNTDSLLAVQQKQKEDTSWLKNEYVPVTSFIHTVSFDNYRRIYEAYQTPENYYLANYYNVGRLTGDSIYDVTRSYIVRNTFAIALLEGFNKWVKSGAKIFAAHSLRHFELPDGIGGKQYYNENNIYLGAQLSRVNGKILHYNVTGEYGMTGKDAGTFKLDANINIDFKLFKDTVSLAANGFFHRELPNFYFRHYHSRHFWWDNNLDKQIHSRIEGVLSLKRTHTTLRVAFDELKNLAYFKRSYDVAADYTTSGHTVTVEQSSSPVTMLTAELRQDLHYRAFHWDNVITYQHSTNENVLPVPAVNIYSNLYLRFKIAHVLKTDLGADAVFFTKYYAPEYAPGLGSYAVQGDGTGQRVKVGSYPVINVYANFHLQHARFFVMYSHVNSGSFNREYFFTPHYPLNTGIFRFGVSWNFFN